MLDRMESEMWVSHHRAFGTWLSARVKEAAVAFRVLSRLQYDAPWRQPARCKGHRA